MLSYRKISENLIMASNVDWTNHDNQRELCIYGTEMLIAAIVNTLIICVLSILFQETMQVLLFMLFYLPGRLFAGGGHASSHTRCITYFCTCIFGIINAAMLITPILPMNSFTWFLFLFIILVIVLYINHVYAASTKQAEVQKRHRRSALIITYLNVGILISLYIYTINHNNLKYYVFIAAGAMILQAVMLLPRFTITK